MGRAERNPSHPYPSLRRDALWLSLEEFDGERTTVPAMASDDNGRTGSSPTVVAEASDASDHPLSVTDGKQVFLSGKARREGYRFMPLENVP